MASRIAETVVRDVLLAIGSRANATDRALAAHNVDVELQEVREVLEGLRNNHGCWCCATDDYEFKPPFVCGADCERARALMEKLAHRQGEQS